MDINELTAWLTDGLDDAAKAVVTAAIQRDSVKAKTAGLKQQSEYDAIQSRTTALEAELNGAEGQPGSREYKEWYSKNAKAIEKLQADNAAYVAKYGTPEAPINQPSGTPGVKTMTAEEIQAEVDKRIQNNYAPRWASLLTDTGTIVQKHMFAGRKTPIDFKALEKIASEKTNGNLEAAYDVWDEPERVKTREADTERIITQRVNDELAKRGASQSFPGGADMTPGALAHRSSSETKDFNANDLKRSLVDTFNKAGAGAVN